VRCGCHSDRTASLGSGPRGAPPPGWYHQQVSLYNIWYLGTLLTQPRPASAALLHVKLFTHQNAEHGIVAVLA
jgi:hypothetical protein